METNSLAAYVLGRVGAGLSKKEIRDELLAVGWSEEEADAAYRDGLIALGIPVPSEGNRPTLARKSSTVDIVINFFSFILLSIAATALGTLYFAIITKRFPDPLAAMNGAGEWAVTSSIHYAIASLLIAFPLYFAAMRIWFRKFREDEGRTESALTRWLTYLVLLVTSVTIVGDLITVLFKLLQGEVTTRFLLKALTILVIAGIIFGFYTLERRKIQYRREIPRTTFRQLGWVVAAIVTLGLVLGFLAAGSPETARMRAFDMQREADLGRLAGCIEDYAQDLGQLPASLDILRTTGRYAHCASSMQDPETKQRYAHRVVTPSRTQGPARIGEFELCANFSLASAGYGSAAGTDDGRATIWDAHGSGRNCDTVTVQLGEKTATGDATDPVTSIK